MISNMHFLYLMYFSPRYGCQMAWSKLWQFWPCCSNETKFLLLYSMETMEQCLTIKSMENAPICSNYLLHYKKFTWHLYSTFRLVLSLSKHFTWTVHWWVNHVHFFLKAKSEHDSLSMIHLVFCVHVTVHWRKNFHPKVNILVKYSLFSQKQVVALV